MGSWLRAAERMGGVGLGWAMSIGGGRHGLDLDRHGFGVRGGEKKI